jgi:di/tricarboxylate transporter
MTRQDPSADVASAPADPSPPPAGADGREPARDDRDGFDWLSGFVDRPAFFAKCVLPLTLALSLATLIWALPQDLSADGRVVLIVLVLAIIGWTMTSLGDSTVAVAAVSALAVLGAVESDDLYRSLGHELIWLLIAAFLIAAVLRAGGLIEPLVLSVAGGTASVSRLFHGLTASIAMTALVIPSTSARAALLLPVFLVLAAQVRSRPIVRALALLFPTVILLSASGSLIGAGAHILAAEVVAEHGGESLDYLGWMKLAMPIALVSSFAATAIILRCFLSPALRRHSVRLSQAPKLPQGWRPRVILAVLLLTVATWIAQPLHGLGMGVVGLAGAFVMLKLAGPFLKTKDAFKSVEVELILFLAVTFTLADAMTKADVDEWLAASFKAVVPGLAKVHDAFVLAAMALIALLSHLVITSRTARAAVLIPSFVLPLAELGGDITTLVMVTIVGTGLCQTMSASAKPVAIFSNAPIPTYAPADLLRLSLALLPLMFILIMAFALVVWPALQ